MQTITRPAGRHDEPTIGVPEILSRFRGRMSYRQFDYWLRTGTIRIRKAATGSGSRRSLTPAEYLALGDLVDEMEAIEARRAAAFSGRFYADRLAVHEA